ncbi:MAG TPA: ATP-binding protein [Rubrobacter sp.]|jgi:AAA+ ATPase superfamily predicted ATPase|nr:ATP-binding protein [Rubrobacter sp.]
MYEQINPFVYGRPVYDEEALADRATEKRRLISDANSGQPVILYAPRRYGKTSLARVVSGRLLEDHLVPSVYADFWGAASISDVVEVLGRAYAVASVRQRARRFFADLLRSVGFSVEFAGTAVSVSYEGKGRNEQQRAALMRLLDVPQQMAVRSPSQRRLFMVLDEFGEVFNVPGEPYALMRNAFQASPNVSFIFMGSKRSLMDALFSERHHPFYNFGRRMSLGRLPFEELGAFIEGRFASFGKRVTPEAVDLLLSLTDGHPHRSQQLAYHAFELASGEADEESILSAKEAAFDETADEFRVLLDRMSTAARAVYLAVCKDPTTEMTSRVYLQRHGIKSTGSLRSAIRTLTDAGDLEQTGAKRPVPTDPLLAAWVRERMNRG